MRFDRAINVAVILLGPTAILAQAPQRGARAVAATPDSIRRYLSEALDTLQRVSVHRDSVDWRALRDSVFAQAAGAQATDDTWRTLQWALRRVDPHSFIQTPRQMPQDPAARASAASAGVPSVSATAPTSTAPQGPPPVSGRLIEGRLGYLVVPWFAGTNRPSFVDSLQGLIADFDSAGACGWIIDLRKNQGGNMWPMLAGVGPLLGDSIVGAFSTFGEPTSPWRYREGHAWSGANEMPTWGGAGTVEPYRVRAPLAPVALLIGRKHGQFR